MDALERTITLPDAPALVIGAREAVIVSPSGEVETVSRAAAAKRAEATPMLYCYGLSVRRKLNVKRLAGFDAMELFAFTRPADFVLPTPLGLARATGLATESEIDIASEDLALLIVRAAHRLLDDLTRLQDPARKEARKIAITMARSGWSCCSAWR